MIVSCIPIAQVTEPTSTLNLWVVEREGKAPAEREGEAPAEPLRPVWARSLATARREARPPWVVVNPPNEG